VPDVLPPPVELAVTVTVQYAVFVPAVALIEVFPVDTAVTTPPLTVAISVEVLAHTTVSVVLDGRTVAVNVPVFPTTSDNLLVLKEIDVALTVVELLLSSSPPPHAVKDKARSIAIGKLVFILSVILNNKRLR
jgi:hypothetical protein